ncbi:MAG: TonB-dependent receptor, partial [Ignavibacteria bacterium]|nr:TonB-dependent receptor [Ignavibacteria bacterium]
IQETQDVLEIVLHSNLKTSDVIVEGDQPSLLISKSEINTTTITKKGLLKAACCNLSESFQTNPSVDVSYSDALTGAKQIQLLGLQGIYIQMLNEKIPSFRGLAQTFGLNYVPGSWMESIQISKGAASVSTGYESITGQINVEYKKPETAEKFFANLYGDQYGRVEGNFNAGMNISEKLSTMLFLHGNMYKNKLDLNNDSFLDKPMVSQINLFNRWSYETDGFESKFGVKALYEDRQGGQKAYYTGGDKPNLFGIDIKTQRYDFFAKNGFVFEDGNSLGTIVAGFYHDQSSLYGKNAYNGKQTNGMINILYDAKLMEETHKISVGATYQYDDYQEKFKDSSFSRTESVPGAFVEYVYSGITNLSVIGGFRADYHNLYGTFWTPRIHFRYNLTDKIAFRGSAGKGFHTPSIFAENSSLLASSRVFTVDEKLKPEEAWNFGLNGT